MRSRTQDSFFGRIVEGKNLIVTYDDERGGIDTDLIQKIIEQTFDLE